MAGKTRASTKAKRVRKSSANALVAVVLDNVEAEESKRHFRHFTVQDIVNLVGAHYGLTEFHPVTIRVGDDSVDAQVSFHGAVSDNVLFTVEWTDAD